jgi:hypothetical protein
MHAGLGWRIELPEMANGKCALAPLPLPAALADDHARTDDDMLYDRYGHTPGILMLGPMRHKSPMAMGGRGGLSDVLIMFTPARQVPNGH